MNSKLFRQLSSLCRLLLLAVERKKKKTEDKKVASNDSLKGKTSNLREPLQQNLTPRENEGVGEHIPGRIHI